MKSLKETLSTNEKNALKKQAAHRILAGFGTCAHSWNYATSYGFSFDEMLKQSSLFKEVCSFLDKEGIKYTTGAGSMHRKINISTRGDNLQKFVKLGEKTWKKVLKLYLPMLDELEKIQDKVDSSTEHNVSRFNYLVSRKCFADYYRKKLVDNEEVHNYEQMIKTWTKFLEVQGNLNEVLKLYEENKKAGIGKYDPQLTNLLKEEYERLTGKKLDK